MRVIRLSTIGLFSVALVSFFACQKEVIKSSAPVIEAAAGKGGGGGTTPAAAFVLNIPMFGASCVSTSFCFDASLENKGGGTPGGPTSISVEVYDALNVLVPSAVIGKTNDFGSSANFCVSGLAAGNYSVRVTYQHSASESAPPQHGTFSFPLAVAADENCGVINTCETNGLTLSRTSLIDVTEQFVAVSVTVNYLVSNCGTTDQTALKLQGGLVSKATLNTATPPSGLTTTTGDATNVVYSLKKTNGNSVLTWVFDLAANKSQSFDVTYSVYPTACGNPLTGQWSLKQNSVVVGSVPADQAGTGGYLNRLMWDCNL